MIEPVETASAAIAQAFEILPEKMAGRRAEVALLAIGLQESRLIYRRQMVGNPPQPTGPAAGLWQFEQSGGAAGVLTHPSTKWHALDACAARGVESSAAAVWVAIQTDDVLAACFARLLLWSDSKPLPSETNAEACFELYRRTWRPGAYARGDSAQRAALHDKFIKNHRMAQL